jgi:hypothetical protein
VIIVPKDIKVFHKFIHSCGFIHIHSPREKQYSNNNYHLFFVCLFAVLRLELRATPSRPNCVMGNFKIGSRELFARAEIEPHPPDLCLLCSYHYRHAPQAPG